MYFHFCLLLLGQQNIVAISIIYRLCYYSEKIIKYKYGFCCCCSVAKSCLTLSNPMDYSMPGSTVLHYLPEFAHSCPLSWWCYLNISSSVAPLSFCLQFLPASESFPVNQVFASCGQSIKASDSVCPKNTQCWFPLGLTGWISLQAKGLSGVFSCTTIQKHQFFGTHYISKASNLWRSVFYGSTLTSVNDYWKNHSFDYRKLCQQNDVSAF